MNHTLEARTVSRVSWLTLILSAALLSIILHVSTATAAGPVLKVTSVSPEYVAPGKGVVIITNVQNRATKPLADVVLTWSFPAGVVPTDPDEEPILSPFNGQCEVSGQQLKCALNEIAPDSQARIIPFARVDENLSGTLLGELKVTGGDEVVTKPFSLTVGEPGPFAIRSLGVSIEDAPSVAGDQAGATPGGIDTTLELRSKAIQLFSIDNPLVTNIGPTENLRNVVTHIPPGVIGFPTATPTRCTQAQLASMYEDTATGEQIGIPACPNASQVGLAQVDVGEIKGLYSLVPPKGAPAAFGFIYFGVVVTLVAEVRPSDNGIDLVARDVGDTVPLPYTDITIWGTPADPSHNRLRGRCLLGGNGYNGGSCPFSEPRVPFLRNPTSCPGTSPKWDVEINTYQHPGTYVGASTVTDQIKGCDKVPFDPEVSLVPTEVAAGLPSGLNVKLSIPQARAPEGLSQADLRKATVELPEGVTINPASADGLAACSDQQLRLGLKGPAECPEGSKVGTLELSTPLLDEPIAGSVFLRSQASKNPESGELFRLALEIRSDERGVAVKLPGSLVVDPDTGKLTTLFKDLPQLPFESMQLHLKTGPRAPLTTPRTCGTYTAHAELEGWNGKTASFDPAFTVDQGCTAPPFAPGFEAGVANSTAGVFAPFSLRVTRGSGQPNVSRIDATLPEGLLAKLAGLPICGGAQAQSGECPETSRIGSVVAGIGEGSSPLYLPQAGKSPTAVYFAGPYKGAPYSIVAKVPAQAGPFDLGQVVVRSAVQIDPTTAQVTVASDSLPQIYSGIPVSYRDVRIQIDRPEFTLNPTDCEPKAVTGAISSIAGQTAPVSDRFQVADCASLGFKPSLALTLGGKTRRAGNPSLRAVLQIPRKGDYANIARAVVTLPGSEFIAQDHLNNVCTRVQYAAAGGGGAGCPKGSVYGRARAFTPLLDHPLEGPVYLRSNGGDRELPDLVASLDGAIHVDLVGYIDSDKRTGGLRTTFARVPDAPVSKFVLKMPGGKKSLLENSTNICHGQHRAIVKMDGQNGRVHSFRPLVRAKCGKGARGR